MLAVMCPQARTAARSGALLHKPFRHVSTDHQACAQPPPFGWFGVPRARPRDRYICLGVIEKIFEYSNPRGIMSGSMGIKPMAAKPMKLEAPGVQ